MSNWFRMTADNSLDRRYLRICAVYRCAMRNGVSELWIEEKLCEVMTEFKTSQLVSIWKQTDMWRDRKKPYNNDLFS